MAVVREMAGSGASTREITAKAATKHRCVLQALAVLRDAPDLADEVSAGTMDLVRAFRALAARAPEQHDGVLGVRYLTAAEVAGALRVSLMTVYRRIADGTLPAIRTGRVIRIPQSVLADHLAGQAISPPAVSGDTTDPGTPADPGRPADPSAPADPGSPAGSGSPAGRSHRAGPDAPAAPPGWIAEAARLGARPEAIAEAAGLTAAAVRKILREMS
jgi:excisionase family DNA binding protein